MSTLTQLFNALHREVAAHATAGSLATSGSTEASRLGNWIIEAEYEIQQLHTDWKFLWSQATVPTIASQRTLNTGDPSYPADVNVWDFETFRIDGDEVCAEEYFEVRGEYPLDTTTGTPSRVIVMPDHTLQLDPIPDGVYSMTADYYATPTRLASGGDTSVIPSTYDLAIIGRAMMMYGNFEDAPEIKIAGIELYEPGLARLENRELPNKKNARFKQGGHFQVTAE